jgi:signal transduction histidine kinase
VIAAARYGLAALLVGLESTAFFFLSRLLDLDRAPFLLFTPSVLLTAVLAGRGAGIFATVLGAVASEVVFGDRHRSHWEAFELVRFALYVASGLGISVLAGHLQDARARAEERAAAARLKAEELAAEVAHRAAMAAEHARLYQEAQSANRMKDEFVATLSHELRTPLNALLGWTDLLRSGRLPPERQREAIEAIHRTALSQAQLTNDLVDVSRAVSGKFQLTPREMAIGDVVAAVADTFRLAAEAKGLHLTCTIAPGLPPIIADPDRVQQIVYNLVGNAVKFTAAGGVTVTASASGDWIALAVADTGIGIRPEFLPHVFERFRQADGSATREFGGLGLGLSIVRALVELHGGTVSADSEGEGRGSTFTVRLPVVTVAAPQNAVAAGERSA